jgi:hypothetical protein
VSEELVLIKGPTKWLRESEQELLGRRFKVDVLVLAMTEGPENEYMRVR